MVNKSRGYACFVLAIVCERGYWKDWKAGVKGLKERARRCEGGWHHRDKATRQEKGGGVTINACCMSPLSWCRQ
jgi:hypothetical protein